MRLIAAHCGADMSRADSAWEEAAASRFLFAPRLGGLRAAAIFDGTGFLFSEARSKSSVSEPSSSTRRRRCSRSRSSCHSASAPRLPFSRPFVVLDFCDGRSARSTSSSSSSSHAVARVDFCFLDGRSARSTSSSSSSSHTAARVDFCFLDWRSARSTLFSSSSTTHACFCLVLPFGALLEPGTACLLLPLTFAGAAEPFAWTAMRSLARGLAACNPSNLARSLRLQVRLSTSYT